MKVTFASFIVAFALMTIIADSARCEDAPHLSAQLFYRDNYATNSNKLQIELDDVLPYYTISRGSSSDLTLAPQCPTDLTFRILTRQPTQAIHWISLPLATFASVDFQWLPLPRSTIGFKNIRITTKDGGVVSVDMLIDGQAYRYTRTDKHGVVKQEIKGELELRLRDASVPAVAGGFGSERFYEWFAMRGIGVAKQRPHSPDNEWIIGREFIDRIEFIAPAEANPEAKDADR
ncbi:MAG: hypothetical protein WCR06_08080 [bacterium]